MATEAVEQMAQVLPEYQTSRGAEFRNTSVEERLAMAQQLVISRSQACASNVDWDDYEYRAAMRRKKEAYIYEAARIGVDLSEALWIWSSVVHEECHAEHLI